MADRNAGRKPAQNVSATVGNNLKKQSNVLFDCSKIIGVKSKILSTHRIQPLF